MDTQFQLHFDGTVTASTLTGLPLHTLLDTGCHKTLLSKKVFDQNVKHFQNYYEIPFLEKHSITVRNGQQIYAHKMIALPLRIQDHYFEFLVLIVDILDEYNFIIGLEAAIQLEAIYHMTSHIVNIQSRSVPLFLNKDIKISPGTSTSYSIKWRPSMYFYIWYSNYKSTASRISSLMYKILNDYMFQRLYFSCLLISKYWVFKLFSYFPDNLNSYV